MNRFLLQFIWSDAKLYKGYGYNLNKPILQLKQANVPNQTVPIKSNSIQTPILL